MDKDTDLKLEAAYLAGFQASGEGYNGEYPFGDRNRNPEHDPVWCKDRDNKITAIKQAIDDATPLVAQPAPDYTKDEALKLALEALKQYTNVVTSVNDPNSWETVGDGGKPARDAITAIEAKLRSKNT